MINLVWIFIESLLVLEIVINITVSLLLIEIFRQKRRKKTDNKKWKSMRKKVQNDRIGKIVC